MAAALVLSAPSIPAGLHVLAAAPRHAASPGEASARLWDHQGHGGIGHRSALLHPACSFLPENRGQNELRCPQRVGWIKALPCPVLRFLTGHRALGRRRCVCCGLARVPTSRTLTSCTVLGNKKMQYCCHQLSEDIQPE